MGSDNGYDNSFNVASSFMTWINFFDTIYDIKCGQNAFYGHRWSFEHC